MSLFLDTGNAKLIIDPTLDGRKEIANFNQLMDQIFVRMNLAIRVRFSVVMIPDNMKVFLPITRCIYLNHCISGKKFRSYGFKGNVYVNGKSTKSKSTQI